MSGFFVDFQKFADENKTLAEIGESKLYMGSKTTPGVLALNNLLPALKMNKPSLYDYLTADGDMVREKALV